jgi:iron complex outermembrane recepter protein
MTRYSEIARALRGVLAGSAITVASVSVVSGQTQPSSPAGANLEEVVVTGSLIRRSDFDTPSPVQVVTAEDLEQSGFTSVSDVLRNIAANGQGTLSQAFGLAFAGGGAGVALRGLTVGGTLTLIDGMRMIPYPLSDDGQRNFVDVSNIPFNVIDRVEVLKDGASAEYGSDAVAGVVNVVLKKTFTGAQVSAEGGAPGQRGGATEHLGALSGIGDLASDGYNAYLAIEYRHQDNILLSDRGGIWTTLNYVPYGGFDTRYGSPNSSPATALFPQIQGGYVLDPATSAVDATTHYLQPNLCASTAAYLAGSCIYQPPFQIQPQTGNLNALGRFTKSLGAEWQGIVTASLFRSEAEQVGLNNQGYPFLNGLNPTTAVTYGPYQNPGFVTYPSVLLPVGAPNNPFSAPAPLVADFPQLGMQQTQFVTNTYRLVGDIKGTAAGFDIDGTVAVMYSALTQKFYGEIQPALLVAAANSGFNFATASAQAMQAAFAPEFESKDTNTMQIADVHAQRQLLELPGGPLSAVVGVGFYHLYKNSLAPVELSNALAIAGNAAYALGGQTNDNAYLELAALPVKGLELDGAVRYDHYNQYGGSTTPKFGLKYSPIRMLTFRGTFGKGFRAPNPAESGKSGALFGGAPFNDATLCPNPATPNSPGNFPSQCNLGLVGLQVSSPNLQPEKSTNWTGGVIFAPFENTKISFDYWDIKINQDIQSGVNVDFLGSGGGVSQSLFPIVRGPQETLPFVNSSGQTVNMQTPTGPVLYQAFPYFNLTQTHVNGIDLDASSHFNIGAFGKLTAQLNATYMFHYIFGLSGGTIVDLAGTHGPEIISGDTGNPKERATASLAWERGPVGITASVNFVGRFNVTDPSLPAFGIDNCPGAIAGGGLGGPQATRFSSPAAVAPSVIATYCDVKAFTDVNLYGQYAWSKSLTFHASILNVFGSTPPVDLQTYGASGGDAYNPAMHQAGAIGRFYNVGAIFTF